MIIFIRAIEKKATCLLRLLQEEVLKESLKIYMPNT